MKIVGSIEDVFSEWIWSQVEMIPNLSTEEKLEIVTEAMKKKYKIPKTIYGRLYKSYYQIQDEIELDYLRQI
jgi:hypothetical protein